ncbi:MAG: hypothetical protein ACRDGV_13455 [Candidatus Limnocylindria bacterium]
MKRPPAAALALVLGALAISLVPPSAVRAAEYSLESIARYEVLPAERRIDVEVDVTFTNTTPDPEGQFSVFEDVLLAVHDAATAVTASDEEGELTVAVAVEDDVNVATVELREGLRFEETATFTLAYQLPDGGDPQLRVRPSLVTFPAWAFGTSGEVSVTLPGGYEVRVDGDMLEAGADVDGTTLSSGAVSDPTRWLALVTALRAPTYTTFSATVPLTGGTADLQVRAFADDEAWGERTLALLERALPVLEERIGLPYPHVGPLVITESVSFDAAALGEQSSTGTEILVAFDQPEFTALHQVSHLWLSPALIDARWLREGLASHVAARVAAGLEVETPFDPAAEAEATRDAVFPLDAWPSNATPAEDRHGYAASWALVDELAAVAGEDAIQRVLQRQAAALSSYEPVRAEAPEPNSASPAEPLTSRAFLDHLETVSGSSVAERYGQVVLVADDAALLDRRAAARAAYDDLVSLAGDAGAPDPVRQAMRDWAFEDAEARIAAASAWIDERDVLLADMEAAGLAAPDRLRDAYRAHGGGPEALAELEAERAVVDAYADATARSNAERSFLERIGLVGGPEPSRQLAVANGRFADGDLRGAAEAITQAVRIMASAETSGMVRLLSAVVVLLILLGLAALVLRRRRYTAAP